MVEVNVSYLIDDEAYQRLVNITEGYKKRGMDMVPEKMFECIMTAGSKYDIDSKMRFHEDSLGFNQNCIGEDGGQQDVKNY